ncbi:hypothetical protein ZWY2020_054076 [Hordeum vulgare]|nr:hypothetical protein ZWY2020_054076 [Hordeum vulgare]
MSFLPTPGSLRCPKGGPRCLTMIMPQCPVELRTTGGCNNDNCGAIDYSRFFKGQCSDAYNYPKDDATSTYTYPSDTNY